MRKRELRRNYMIRVLCIYGTRPEAYKMIPLVMGLNAHPEIDCKICVTAQHRSLLDLAHRPFRITADYDLDIMTADQTLTKITTRVLQGLPEIIDVCKPDIVLVHGDTTTAFAASLAAFYAKVKIGHVEAGLRSNDKFSPFPEEMNRKLTGSMADLHFAPTNISKCNLIKENVLPETIYVTGNTAIDLIKFTVKDEYIFRTKALNKLDFGKRIILMAAHRGESRGKVMEGICRAAFRIVNEHPDVMLVWPVHPGKAVAEPAHAILGGHNRIMLTEPIDVFDMHNLMRRAYLLLTDSGGLQEEAPSFNLPTVVMRDVTERPEGLDAGTLVLAGTDEDRIVEVTSGLLNDKSAYKRMAETKNPFGDGNSSGRIIDAILERIKEDSKGL